MAISRISRRDLFKVAGAGGALTVLGTVGVESAAAQKGLPQGPPDFFIGPGGRKPVSLPDPGETDPAAHARHDVLFWTDQLMEHALFLAILLPGAEAASLRRQALRFQRTFRQHLATVSQAWIDQTNFVALNLQTIDLVLPLVEFKLQLEDAQRSGQIRSLVWPSFASHLAAEVQRFVERLDTLSRGHIEFDLAELVPFWSRIMGEHSLFVAHLLDPYEGTLIDQARILGATFQEIGSSGDVASLMAAGELILGFKETAETGIETAQIQSIIHPALADHIRREAIKFLDELQRTV